MKGTAKPYNRAGWWRVKFDNGLDLYPITADELRQIQARHDVTARGAVSS